MLKYMPAFFILLVSVFRIAQAQVKNKGENVLITSTGNKTNVRTDEKGELLINVSVKDVSRFKKKGLVRYSDFGAKGDGKTDDMEAIVAAHAFANKHQLAVKADDGATYYIAGKNRTAIIQTNTDFGKAAFIIDDTNVENIEAAVFLIGSTMQSIKLIGINSLKRNQEKIEAALPGPCLVTVTNANVKRYIRFGPNQNSGSSQTDIFKVDKNGNVDMNAPIVWDFDQVTDITALPIDETVLTITGGRFTTIANKVQNNDAYYSRGFAVRRSNVVLNGLEHYITGEGEHGAPYNGFVSIRDCYNVTVRNMMFTGHKVYQFAKNGFAAVSKGTYDIAPARAINLSFINCRQSNDINDKTYWGIMGSNFCKNILLDSCIFSRFDAHQGVANATIRNSTLGHQGINAIGSGKFIVENSTIYGNSIVNLRSDYGSTWQGELIIRNCVYVPGNGKAPSVNIINGSNSGQHNFGYTCYLPSKITIENLRINDADLPANYKGPAIFSNFNPKLTDETYQESFPYVRAGEVMLRNISVASGKTIRVSDNLYMFKDVKIKKEGK